jgi:LacI family transcriptional regulator, galactose operon repressor
MAASRKSTLVLVAELAGVSIASVSRVMNGLPASQGITERVRAAAAELGYVPDATARSLKVGRTEQVALAVADVGNPVYLSMMRAISAVVTRAGYRLVLSPTGSDPKDQVDLLVSLNRGFADGLIMSPLRVTEELGTQLRASRLPIVVIGSLPPGVELDTVRADSVAGMALAVGHLAEQGRERIAFVNGPVDTVPGAASRGGYLSALAARNLPDDADTQVTATDFTYRAGIRAATTLLDRSTPDAIVGANDLLAIAALNVATRRGLRVPEDVAIVGMDDTDVADLANPAITSVDLGATRRAKAAATLLLRRMECPAAPVRQVVVAPTLTVRGSSTLCTASA